MDIFDPTLEEIRHTALEFKRYAQELIEPSIKIVRKVIPGIQFEPEIVAPWHQFRDGSARRRYVCFNVHRKGIFSNKQVAKVLVTETSHSQDYSGPSLTVTIKDPKNDRPGDFFISDDELLLTQSSILTTDYEKIAHMHSALIIEKFDLGPSERNPKNPKAKQIGETLLKMFHT